MPFLQGEKSSLVESNRIESFLREFPNPRDYAQTQVREPLSVLTVRILGWTCGARQGQTKVRSEPNLTEFFICSTYLSGRRPGLATCFRLRYYR